MAQYQANLKLVIDYETTRPNGDVLPRFDPVFEAAKKAIRSYVRTLTPPVTILRWHYHASTGPVTDIEP